MITVHWYKCGKDGHYCDFDTLDLGTVTETGVYVIWHTGKAGNPGRVVRIGQGKVADRIAAHRKDQKVLAYKQHGELRVTWAALPAHQMDGVERYLANTWPPLVGDVFPDVKPLEVNSPFAA
jgi:hypothetical protein